MPGPIERFMADDHARLAALLERAVADPERIDHVAYGEFRAGLLRHIGMEEKLLLPAAKRLSGGRPPAMADRLRLDHGALTALLVPTPTPAIVGAIRGVLACHNAIEEGPQGLYARCDALAGAEAQRLVSRLRESPAVPVRPYNDDPRVTMAVCRALRRAGYDREAAALET